MEVAMFVQYVAIERQVNIMAPAVAMDAKDSLDEV